MLICMYVLLDITHYIMIINIVSADEMSWINQSFKGQFQVYPFLPRLMPSPILPYATSHTTRRVM